MRKVAWAVLCGALVVTACGEDSPESPMAPAPESSEIIRCVNPGFPIKLALEQIAGSRNIVALYPPVRPRPLALALARVAEIAALWTLCKSTEARAKLAVHTNILLDDFQAGRLKDGTSSATAGRVIAHINTMWSGVGLQAPNPPITPGTGTNFGFGFFIPGTPLLVKTVPAEGAVMLPANAFNQPTLVTILQRPNTPNPFAESGFQVFPPFYEIIASNAGNIHYLNNGVFAVVGFCVDDVATPIFQFGDPAIAHIAVAEGANAGGFEILDNASAAQYAALGLSCTQYSPPIGSLFDGGLRSFAAAAPQYLRTAVATMFLPARLEAAVGKTGLGSLARSLSPFGVVDRGNPLSLAIESGNNQSGFTGQILTAPLVVRVTRNEQPVQGVQVSFQVTSGGGSITSTATTNAAGLAEAIWTLGSSLGAQTAAASVFGAPAVTFTATAAPAPPARIVLQWGATPPDLDSHLTGPTGIESPRFHVFFANPGSLLASPFAALDRDDVDGVGPETITISQFTDGRYRYSVHDFTNRLSETSSALGTQSTATVTLYLASSPTPQVFTVPNAAGTLWTVFELTVSGATTTVTPFNTMGFTADPSGGPFLRMAPSQAAAGNDVDLIRESTRDKRK